MVVWTDRRTMAPLNDKPKIQTLFDVGTRYTHYMDLREIFADGIEILKNAMAVCESEVDKKRIESLQHAVNEIDNRLEVLAGYEEKMTRWGSIAAEIDGLYVPKQITENSHVKPEIKSSRPYTNRNRTDYKKPTDDGDCV
jgi:hypothetical protein